jgi:hypothetical protein
LPCPGAPFFFKKREARGQEHIRGQTLSLFHLRSVFLKDKPAKKYLASNNVIARLMLPFMRYSKDDWIEASDSGIKGVLELIDPTKARRRNAGLTFRRDLGI